MPPNEYRMHITARDIITSIPRRFRSEKAAGVTATVHLDISGEETLYYTVIIREGKCELREGAHGQPDCVVKTKAKTYIDLETGKANPQMALMLGKVKVSNLAVMMQFVKCFRKFDPSVYEQKRAAPRQARPAAPMTKTGPLAGLKVIDFTRLLPGPLATMFLADMGADVIKIEDPDSPDYVRDFEPRVNGVSMFYLALNRNKRSLAVNYLQPEGKEIIYDLVKNADVVVEQFRPGVMQEIGFGYDALRAINPRLIYVSVSGYGQHGSRAREAGHDLNYIALGGALGITGTAAGELTIPGFQLADIGGGSYMAMVAVLAALYQREKTGRGEWVDVSMTDAVLPFCTLPFAYMQGTGNAPAPAQFELSGALANYNVYRCADGRYVALGSLEPKFWNAFCRKLNRHDWAERLLGSNEDVKQLKEEVKALFLTKTRDEWLAFFRGEDICLTTVNSLSELTADAGLRGRNMFLAFEHPDGGKYHTINQPLKFLSSQFQNSYPAPELGAHSADVLQEIGYDPSKIERLQQSGIVKSI
ncbi:MAG: CoA transferase [Chitinophagales bacterium]|nr:CoA transferase [Chitinophagales bacterium]